FLNEVFMSRIDCPQYLSRINDILKAKEIHESRVVNLWFTHFIGLKHLRNLCNLNLRIVDEVVRNKKHLYCLNYSTLQKGFRHNRDTALRMSQRISEALHTYVKDVVSVSRFHQLLNNIPNMF
ncbi:hypothetical protein L9F63_014480, partial [Diploptera punctata]